MMMKSTIIMSNIKPMNKTAREKADMSSRIGY